MTLNFFFSKLTLDPPTIRGKLLLLFSYRFKGMCLLNPSQTPEEACKWLEELKGQGFVGVRLVLHICMIGWPDIIAHTSACCIRIYSCDPNSIILKLQSISVGRKKHGR